VNLEAYPGSAGILAACFKVRSLDGMQAGCLRSQAPRASQEEEPLVWVKTKERAGMIRLSARHPALGVKSIQIRVVQQDPVEI
jgi:hypothetical protein